MTESFDTNKAWTASKEIGEESCFGSHIISIEYIDLLSKIYSILLYQ